MRRVAWLVVACLALTQLTGCKAMRRWKALSDAPSSERIKALETQVEMLTLQIDRLDEELRFNVASNQVSLGKYEEAIKGFREVVTRYPSSGYAADSLYEIAKIYKYNLKNFVKAVSSYNDLLKGYPKSEFIKTAAFEAADCLMEIGKKSEALAQYRSVIAKFGRDPVVEKSYFEIGEIHHQDKKYEDAKQSYEKLLDAFPSGALRPAARNKLASCLVELGDTVAAIRQYESVYTGHPTSDFAELSFFSRISLLVATGKDSDAGAAIGQYNIRYPGGRFRSETDRFLQKIETKKPAAP